MLEAKALEAKAVVLMIYNNYKAGNSVQKAAMGEEEPFIHAYILLPRIDAAPLFFLVAPEVNPERRSFYQLCWYLDGSQGDVAMLKGKDVDWENGKVSFFRSMGTGAHERTTFGSLTSDDACE